MVLQSVENLIFSFFKVASQSNFLSPMLLTTLNASLFFPGKILFTIFWLFFVQKRRGGRVEEYMNKILFDAITFHHYWQQHCHDNFHQDYNPSHKYNLIFLEAALVGSFAMMTIIIALVMIILQIIT